VCGSGIIVKMITDVFTVIILYRHDDSLYDDSLYDDSLYDDSLYDDSLYNDSLL